MAQVPVSGVITITDIMAGINTIGLSTVSGTVSWQDLVNAADWDYFDPAFLEGAASKADIKRPSQFRGYPRNAWWNEYREEWFEKNTCGYMGTGQNVKYEVAAGTYRSFISQANANSLADAEIASNGQSYANSTGSCTWWNDAMAQDFQKNNCGGSYTGTWETYSVAAGSYSSNLSKSDANAQAQAEIDANGQSYANSTGDCTYNCESPEMATLSIFSTSITDGKRLYIIVTDKNNTHITVYHDYYFSNGHTLSMNVGEGLYLYADSDPLSPAIQVDFYTYNTCGDQTSTQTNYYSYYP